MARGGPKVLHLLPDGSPQGAARTALLIAGLGKDYRHFIKDANDTQRGWLPPASAKAVTWITDFPELAGRPMPRRLNRLARAMLPYDLVVTHGYGSMNAVMARTAFAEAYSLPSLVHHEWDDEAGLSAWARRKRDWFRRFALGKAAGLVVPDERLEGRALVDWQQPLGRVKHIADGIDVRAFAKRPRADALPTVVKRPGETWIGVVDESGALQGLERTLDVLADLPEECLLIWATPTDRKRAIVDAADARALNHRVHPVPQMPDLHRFIGLFDILLAPDPHLADGKPVLAAMASGLPVAGQGNAQLLELAAEENRSLLEQDTKESLRQLVAQPAFARSIGEANRRRALAEYDNDKLFATYRRLFDSAVAQRRPAR